MNWYFVVLFLAVIKWGFIYMLCHDKLRFLLLLLIQFHKLIMFNFHHITIMHAINNSRINDFLNQGSQLVDKSNEAINTEKLFNFKPP